VVRLRRSSHAVETAKRYERSRQLIENKDEAFWAEHESRQVTENMDVSLFKAVNILIYKDVIKFWQMTNHGTYCKKL
jgi:hypothetical protein